MSRPVSREKPLHEKADAPYIQVPLSLMSRKDISQTAKLLYGLIVCLSHQAGYCYASDDYIAERIGVSKRQTQRAITELETLRIVLITGATSRRHIRPANDKNGVSYPKTDDVLTTKTSQDSPPLTTKTSSTNDKNGAIIEKGIKKKIEKILPAAVQEAERPQAVRAAQSILETADTAFARARRQKAAQKGGAE